MSGGRDMSHWRDTGPIDCKVYVGDLGQSGTKHELERAFSAFGPLRNVWVARNPPGFAFVEFDDPRDARDAVDAMDGRYLCGRRVRVELSHGMKRSSRYRPPPPNSYRGYDRPQRRRSRSPRDRRRSRSRSRSRDRKHSRSHSHSRSRSVSPINLSPRGKSPLDD
ncbi:serine/arginine-rich splicing factor 3-like isoform X3 [Branchiostoma lanceolatum]|uniref:serine/arginine-rich splicing factor 3-like isoform X3 n=1 Tax=Branchiostoma lanceolatum TaxID=7740 RepID=UPI003455AC3E